MTTTNPKKDTVSLIELQKFLVEELAEASPTSTFQRAFQPLTDGLGLESPKNTNKNRQQPLAPMRRISQVENVLGEVTKPVVETREPAAPSAVLTPLDLLTDEEMDRKRAAEMFLGKQESKFESQEPQTPAAEKHTEFTPPPPVPRPSILRRLAASLLDFFFVGVLFAIVLVLTAQLSGRMEHFSVAGMIATFSKPPFPIFGMLEYMALWFCYYFVALGLMDNTFGMWVWGLKLSSGEGNTFARKILRILVSTFLVPTIVPAILLSFRRHSRNLVDLLSGTSLYLSAA